MVEPFIILSPFHGVCFYSCNHKLKNNYMSSPVNEKKIFTPLRDRISLIKQRFFEVFDIPENERHEVKIYTHFKWSQGKWQGLDKGKTQSIRAADAAKISSELGLDYKWVATGLGSPYPDKNMVREKIEVYKPEPIPEPDLIEKTKTVLDSDTVYARALESNIDAFYSAIKAEKELKNLQAQKEDHDKRIASLEEYIRQLPQIRQLNEP